MNKALDSRGLELFLAVADTLSFRQAAERLHISQPPLSRAIRQLEDRLGTPLFLRDTRSVRLTAAGERLLPYARKIMSLLAQAQASVAAPVLPTRLRLGMTTAVEPPWFRGLVARIEASGRFDTVIVVSDTSPRLVRRLRARQLDAALIALPTETEGLAVTVLDRQSMVVALSSAHRLARRRTLSLADLARERLFMFERARQPAFFDHCHAVFRRHGFEPRTLREPADHHVLLAGVADGAAFALLPRSFTSLKRAGVSYRPLKEGEELAVSVGLATQEDRAGLRVLLSRYASGRR
ncbi:LysR substrate-binding domain-containing protein [Bordetella genomosp. 11]|uniref:LysR family transcriptional regulator n=1 Tax=Bordetella genomosp. 11 TaxID=1416808 RepID=A0A261UYF4_9BORD|nr:LysR substrate-binding domain-containing protein [Bordetella genomosp. 11]OZI66382.1 LysR family transcriptional regulator [Bordetella genomosp. 11]